EECRREDKAACNDEFGIIAGHARLSSSVEAISASSQETSLTEIKRTASLPSMVGSRPMRVQCLAFESGSRSGDCSVASALRESKYMSTLHLRLALVLLPSSNRSLLDAKMVL